LKEGEKMPRISAVFENIDFAQTAAVQLRNSLKTVSDLKYDSAGQKDESSDDVQAYFNGSNSDTRFGDYFNYGFYFNNFTPFSSPYNSRYGYFEPQQGSKTRLTVTVGDTEAAACQSILRSHGGTKISTQSL